MATETASTRERLIESTRELLWERGYVGTSPTAILHRSGVGQGSMYHFFKGKPDLVLAAEQRSAELMQNQMRAELVDPAIPPSRRIARYLRRRREVLRGCSVGQLTADPEVITSDVLRQPLRETFDIQHDLLAHVVDEARAAGELDAKLDPGQTARAVAAVLQGGYVLARAAQSVEPFDQAVAGVLAMLGIADA